MSDTPVNVLMRDVLQYQYNPAGIQRAALAALSRATNGELQIVDPTNPFVFCLEAAAVNTAAFMIKNEASTRMQYPYAAQNEEELYPHMSDEDFVDRFATACVTKFSILMPLEEVLSRMVLDPATGIRKLVLPRNSFFTVADIPFSMQYPVEIRQLAHGGLQVVYDVEQVSPLQSLPTNVIDHEIRVSKDGEWLFFRVDTMQFSVVSQTNTLNMAQDFRTDITLQDLYYYTRVYVQNPAGAWQEIRTTHTDQVYDIKTPTAVLKVVDKTVSVAIPQIYTSTGVLRSGIRIDVYQTKGPLDMLLYEYPASAFTATWKNYDPADDTIYSAPIKSFRTLLAYCDQVVSGGALALTFDQLRERVIKNAMGKQQIPITNVQIEESLKRQGYQVVKNIDLITNRVFLATKGMPDPADPTLITAAAASIATVGFSLKEAVLLSSVKDNATQITITPETIYKNLNGIVSMVRTQELVALLALPPEKRAAAVTQSNYRYTPFHYVLDTASNEFEARPYYLDDPVIATKIFVGENDTTLIQVATDTYSVMRVPSGYVLRVTTKSAQAYKDLSDDHAHAQLAYTPAGERDRAYLNGTLIGKTDEDERIYEFNLATNFKIDKADNLHLTKFAMYSDQLLETAAPLLTDFDVLYATSAVVGSQWRPNGVDATLGKFLLPARIAGMAHEKLRVQFGYALKTLWAKARSVISSVAYETWDVDVPRLYEQDVYERDSSGSAVRIVDGAPVTTILHHKDDPVLDSDENPVMLHYKGDVKLDAFGQPMVKDPRAMFRQVDMMLIEGAYWFATDAASTTYRATMTATVVDWLINDLASIEKVLLEKTQLYYYPKTTMGMVNVMVQDGVVKAIAAGQAFTATLFVSANVYDNAELRAKLAQTTVQVINDALTSTTVSLDAITTALRASYGNDVISVAIAGLGGTEQLSALTVLDDSNRLSIRKRLVALADGNLIVEEDVTTNFVRHELKL